MTKFLAWLSPLSDTKSYLRPGRSSFRIMTGFLPLVGETRAEGVTEDKGAWTRLGTGDGSMGNSIPRQLKDPLQLEVRQNGSSVEGTAVSKALKSISGKSAWSEVKSVWTDRVRPIAIWASEALGNWTKERKAFSAALSLAFFLVGPEPSKSCPFTSTVIAKTGAWTGPVCDTSLYWSPGLISFSCMRAFLGRTGPGTFLRFFGRYLECVCPLLPSSKGRFLLAPLGSWLAASVVVAAPLVKRLPKLRFSLTSALREPAVPRKSNVQRLRCRIL